MAIIRSGRKSESDGAFDVRRGRDTTQLWSEITVRVFDDNGAETDTATGVLTGEALKSGSGRHQDFTETIDLATDDWSWRAELAFVQEFRFSIAGLNANYQYEVSVISGS